MTRKQTPTLIDAVTSGSLPAVEAALTAGADLHAFDDYALRWSARNNMPQVVGRLLAAGADVHARQDSALWIAAQHGHRHVVDRLLTAGADVAVVMARLEAGDAQEKHAAPWLREAHRQWQAKQLEATLSPLPTARAAPPSKLGGLGL